VRLIAPIVCALGDSSVVIHRLTFNAPCSIGRIDIPRRGMQNVGPTVCMACHWPVAVVTPRRFSASAAAYVERCKVSGMEELPNLGLFITHKLPLVDFCQAPLGT